MTSTPSVTSTPTPLRHAVPRLCAEEKTGTLSAPSSWSAWPSRSSLMIASAYGAACPPEKGTRFAGLGT